MTDGVRHAAIALGIGLVSFALAAGAMKARDGGPRPQHVEILPPAVGDGGVVQMSLLSLDGQPLTCMATLWEETDSGRRMGMDSSQQCGPGGVLRWEGVEPGEYRLMVAGKGSARFEQLLQVRGGEIVDLGPQRVGPGGHVGGRVLDADGEPVGQVDIAIGDRRERGLPGGDWHVKGLPAGPQVLRFGSVRGTATLEVDVLAGETLTRDVTLTPHAGVIGVRFDDRREVLEVHPNSPAAGLIQVGERIDAVDGVPCPDRKTLTELLPGPAGEPVVLTLSDRDVEVVRTSLEEMLK